MSCGRTGEESSADVKKASQNSPGGSLHISAQTGFSELKSIRVSVRRKGVCAVLFNGPWLRIQDGSRHHLKGWSGPAQHFSKGFSLGSWSSGPYFLFGNLWPHREA